MSFTKDSIPEGMISISDALDLVRRTIGQGIQDGGSPESLRSGQLRASAWLRDRLAEGSLVALFWDAQRKSNLQVDRANWASMGTNLSVLSDQQLEEVAALNAAHPAAIEALGVFEAGVATAKSGKVTLFLDRQSVDKAVAAAAPPRGRDVVGRGMRSPASPGDVPDLQLKVLEICEHLWPDGYKGRAKKRNDAILQEFQRRYKDQISVKTIQRALRSLRPD
ncbi:hypothetical protein [Bradyrhizobium sp. RT6a]|uniref:hypothetical protein n=1 Tax=unclassified Bradyrhizobium TaxID=2631580 RepID=UPI003391B06E